MLIPNAGFQPSPADRPRWPGRWASGLTPARMTQIFDQADNGMVGALYETCDEIVGKDPQVGGPYADRLVASGAVDIQVEPNPNDPDKYRAVEAAAYAEDILPNLRLYGFEGTGAGRSLVEKGCGEVSDVIEALASPWWKGLGAYWVIYESQYGHPRPRPIGIEYLDSRRYRLGHDDSLLLEDKLNQAGQPMRAYDWYRWFSVDAARAGQRLALSGVGRSLIFWWWLRITGAFDLSRYLEKFGIPNVIGELALNEGSGAITEEMRADLDLFAESYQSDVAAWLPPGVKPNILQAAPGGHAVFTAIHDLTKSAILYGILGNEVTTSAQGSGGSGIAGGAGSVGERIQYDLVLSDRRRAAGALRKLLKRGLFVEYSQHIPAPLVKLLPAGASAPSNAPAPSVQGQAPASSSAAPAGQSTTQPTQPARGARP